MANKPTVSVVTITHNHEKYIREALDSFLAQKTDFAFEVIVADDCSTDNTQAIIREYADKYPEIFRPILRRKNIGAVANSLDSLRAATGKYIALCEGDDYWTDPTKLQQQVDFLDKNPDYALCFHLVRVFSEDGSKEDYVFPDMTEKSKFTLAELLRGNFIQTNSVMYRRQDYTNMPTDILPLDWYYHLYHAQFGKIGFIRKVMSAYRRHAGGMWWNSDRDIDEIWRRHGLAHLSMYVAVLELYKGNDTYESIIYRHVTNMFNNLIATDQKYGDELLHIALQKYPAIIEPVMVMLHQELRQNQIDAYRKGEENAELNRQLQQKDMLLRTRDDEIAHMKSSKFWKMHDRYWQAKTFAKRHGKVNQRLRKKN